MKMKKQFKLVFLASGKNGETSVWVKVHQGMDFEQTQLCEV